MCCHNHVAASPPLLGPSWYLVYVRNIPIVSISSHRPRTSFISLSICLAFSRSGPPRSISRTQYCSACRNLPWPCIIIKTPVNATTARTNCQLNQDHKTEQERRSQLCQACMRFIHVPLPCSIRQENLKLPQHLFLLNSGHPFASKTVQSSVQHALCGRLLDTDEPTSKSSYVIVDFVRYPQINPSVALHHYRHHQLQQRCTTMKWLLTRKLTETPSSSPSESDLSKQLIAASALLIDSAW